MFAILLFQLFLNLMDFVLHLGLLVSEVFYHRFQTFNGILLSANVKFQFAICDFQLTAFGLELSIPFVTRDMLGIGSRNGFATYQAPLFVDLCQVVVDSIQFVCVTTKSISVFDTHLLFLLIVHNGRDKAMDMR